MQQTFTTTDDQRLEGSAAEVAEPGVQAAAVAIQAAPENVQGLEKELPTKAEEEVDR